jgi:hypothetical protein
MKFMRCSECANISLIRSSTSGEDDPPYWILLWLRRAWASGVGLRIMFWESTMKFDTKSLANLSFWGYPRFK